MKKSIPVIAMCMSLLSVPCAAFFYDVSEGDKYYEAIKYVSENKILVGTGDSKFEPEANLTRAMVAQIIYNTEETPEVKNENTYIDVINGKWYEKAVIWAAENNIMIGVGNDKFQPDTFITEEQLITILHNYAMYKNYDVSVGEDTNILSYEDCFEIAEYAYAPMQWACGAGIITEKSGKIFPKKELTRAEISEIIMKFIKYYSISDTAWVELNGNPSTGYVWHATGYDKNIIEVSDYEFIQLGEETLLGRPGKFKFGVKAISEGTTTIIFKYGRTWEDKGVDTREINVEVDSDHNIHFYDSTMKVEVSQ